MARRGVRTEGGGLSQELRRFHSHRRQLHKILGETQKCLKEVSHMNLFPLESAIAEAVRISREGALRPASIVTLGPARARLVNYLLGESLLPTRSPALPPTKGWRWLRLKHGPRRQIRLSLGMDFEVVEPNMALDSNWDQIPHKDLKRSDTMDLSTVMDIELCNPFLENSVQILVPPDLGELSLDNKTPYDFTHESTIKDYETFYAKRGALLENIYPIIVYAIDELGPIGSLDKRKTKIKIDHFSNLKPPPEKRNDSNPIMNGSKSFLSRFKDFVIRKDELNAGVEDCDIASANFFTQGNCANEVCGDNSECVGNFFKTKREIKAMKADRKKKEKLDEKLKIESERVETYSGLSEENLLDLRQIYELHPNSQVLFVLFSDSVEQAENKNLNLRLIPNVKVMPEPETAGKDEDSNMASLENYSLTLNESPLSMENMYAKSADYATTSEYSSVSPMSDFLLSPNSEFSQRPTKDSRDLKMEPCMETDEKLLSSANSSESIVFQMDEESDREKLLDKQRTFLACLVEQLALMTHPLSQQKFTGHWLIVDDSKMNSLEAMQDSPPKPGKNKLPFPTNTGFTSVDNVLQRDEFIYNLVTFSKGCLRNYILDDCNELSEIHNALLQQFIISSFDMAREMQIVPRKIHYVAVMEQQLYDTLHEKFTGEEKKEELFSIVQRVLQEMKNSINCIDWEGRDSSCHVSADCVNQRSQSIFYNDRVLHGNINQLTPNITTEMPTQPLNDSYHSRPDLLDNITDEYLQEYDVIDSPMSETSFTTNFDRDVFSNNLTVDRDPFSNNLNINSDPFPNNLNFDSDAFSNNLNFVRPTELVSPVVENPQPKLNGVTFDIEAQSDNVYNVKVDVDCCKATQVSFKQASLEVQRAVLARLSMNISAQLVKYVDCLRDSYFGTLQRCLESLEEGRGRRPASEAVRRILLVTRSLNLQQCASFSFLHALVDHLRRFFHRLSISVGGGKSCCVASPQWRKQVALDTIESLNATKLARLISMQLRERVRLSHEQFQSALQALSDHHAARLQQTEDLKLAVRKLHAPRFARLCLESTSLRDLVNHGLPHLSKEIGRGQYGVVYAVKGPWAGYEPCAVKSVVPPDERHFNELAMEFFHTRNIPAHDRIVPLRGSVIDHSYAGGSPAVLLISRRLKWDLHCALLNADMTFQQRMQVAVDIVEGIRFLHSQGLLHRDIKLKNVLLEEDHRAKLTDLGFCIPEAMMSGSIVGTPVHMAPELMTGLYDSSVDVYAFGVLFWYVCAGSVKLPSAFEHFQNKEQLWSKVRKGLRPERLPAFSDACWELMERCWSGDPSQRPLLGDVQPVLEDARDHPEVHCIHHGDEATN